MPLYKDDLYDLLLEAGLKAGFRVTGEKYFRDRTQERAFQGVVGVWPCQTKKNGEPDCIWMKQDGSAVAAFEVEGYDVEDKYTGGIMKDGLYLSSTKFANAVKAIILFGLKDDRKSPKNGQLYPENQMQAWAKKRAQALASLYNVPSHIPIVLDDEVTGGLLTTWVQDAQRR